MRYDLINKLMTPASRSIDDMQLVQSYGKSWEYFETHGQSHPKKTVK